MKKFKTLLLTSLTAVLLCFCFLFAGCGSVAGTYKFKSMEVMGVEYKVGDSMMGIGELKEDYMVVELKEDNTATFDGEECTWEEKDGKIVLSVGEGEDSYEIASFEKKGSKLIMEKGDNKLILKK